MLRSFLILMLAISGCTADYYVNSQQKQETVSNYCENDDQCKPGLKCVLPQFDNCQNDINCLLLRTRGDTKAKCRELCDLASPSPTCPTSQRCVLYANLNSGICLEGTCDKDDDCGKNGTLHNKCLDSSNGPKSGMCAMSCNPLNCHNGSCSDCTSSKQNACEILAESPSFICVPSGEARAYSPCDGEKNFCIPGHFCHQNLCHPYCNTKQSPSSCDKEARCRAFFTGSEIGFCEKNI